MREMLKVKQKRLIEFQIHLTMSKVTHSKAEHDFIAPLFHLRSLLHENHSIQSGRAAYEHRRVEPD